MRIAVAQLFHHELRLELVAWQRILVDERELLLPTGDGGTPVGAVGLGRGAEFLRSLDEPLDDELAVALDANVVLPDLAEPAGSISTWTIFAGAKPSSLPVTRSSKRAPSEMRRSLLHGGGGVVAVHAGHAEAELMAIRNAPRAIRVVTTGICSSSASLSSGSAAWALNTTADIEHRPFGLGDQGTPLR